MADKPIKQPSADHPITIAPNPALVVVTLAGRTIASSTEALEFYAITTPAWSSDDDVHTSAPAGAPR